MDYSEFRQRPELSDEEFVAERVRVKPYTVLILKKGPNFEPPDSDPTRGVTKIIWQHGKRNTALQKVGLLPVVCPIGDGSEIAGIGVFNTGVEEAADIMSDDPAVQAQVLTFELHPARSFAGSTLP